jgi:hypothetical protein
MIDAEGEISFAGSEMTMKTEKDEEEEEVDGKMGRF